MFFKNQNSKDKIGIVMVTGSCCIRGLKPIEKQARQTLEEIKSEIDTNMVIKEISVIAARSGALPEEIMTQGMERFNQVGFEVLPMLIIDGEIVSTGYPLVKDEIKRVVLEKTSARLKVNQE